MLRPSGFSIALRAVQENLGGFFNEKWIPIYLYRVNQNGFTFSSQDFGVNQK